MSCLESADDSCAYCGLPLAPPWRLWNAAQPAGVPQFCCTGCQFAAEVAAERDASAGLGTVLGRVGLAAFLTLNVLVFTMALWTDDVYGRPTEAEATLDQPLSAVFRYLSLLLSLPVAWLLGWPLLENAWRQFRRGQLSTDLLLSLGVASAFAYSTVSVFRGAGHVYFEVGCVVLLAVTIGRSLESTGKVRASEALERIEKLLPAVVRTLRDGRESHVPLAEIVAGNCLRVVAGERIATDGIIVAGAAAIDQSLITGESEPVHRQAGDRVLGGTLNLDGQLTIEASASVADGALQRLVQHVRQARFAKGYYQQLADRVAAVFLPFVAIVALVAAAWHAYYTGLDAGLMVAMAVVLIACPCALALATPLATWSALNAAAVQHVLFKRGEALERLATVKAICFDKTGTLTNGTARVAEFAVARHEAAEVLAVAALLSGGSNHPHSRAIAQRVEQQLPNHVSAPQAMLRNVCEVRTLPGRGLVGRIENIDTLWLGNLRLMDEAGLQIPTGLQAAFQPLVDSGRSLTAVGWQGQVRGLFTFDERIRAETHAAIDELTDMGLHIEVLTGDHAPRAAQLSETLRIAVRSGLLPEDKQALITELKRRFGTVAMVGDGVNDAPALATADVGIALGCGADVSRDSADVCLLGNDLRRIASSIRLARATVRVIRQNLFWSLIYNVVGVGLAAAGWLNPLWAAGAMVVSSLLVIGNSARLGGSPVFEQDSELDAMASGLPAPVIQVHPQPALSVAPALVVADPQPELDSVRARSRSYA